MKTIKAVYNAGRWLVYCKTHGTNGAMPAQDEYICPVCYPGIIASFLALKNGRIALQPDRSARRTARMMAENDNEIYAVKFPKEKEQIEKALTILPETRRHWKGEKLTEAREAAKREKHLLDNYNKRDKSKDGSNPVLVVTKGGK